VGEAFAKARDYPVLSHETTITAKSTEVEEDSIVLLAQEWKIEGESSAVFVSQIDSTGQY